MNGGLGNESFASNQKAVQVAVASVIGVGTVGALGARAPTTEPGCHADVSCANVTLHVKVCLTTALDLDARSRSAHRLHHLKDGIRVF